MTPPGVSADRLTFLQKVFAETFSDPAFIADAEKIGFRDIKPQTGPDLEKLIADVYSQPKDVVDLLKYIYTGERN
jgi:tripartite-type tricarboxylate transporter receptor subunit TctC